MSDKLVITGIGASAGVATGPVCVIYEPAEFAQMRADAVLVCPMTTPEWVPVMTQAAAIVTDHGGKMSHAAIVCRELGTPAVVGTGSATRDLNADATVKVDGAKGKVYVDE